MSMTQSPVRVAVGVVAGWCRGWWWCDDNGTFHLRGRLHGLDGLTVTNLLAAMAEADSDSDVDPESGGRDPFDARCADALVELCHGLHDDPGPQAVVVIHAALDALDADGADGVAMTWDGTAVATDSLRRLLCDTRLRVNLDGPDGHSVGIGRRSRTIPARLVDELRWRDGGCRFPGCERTRWLHGHHLQHWADGGRTDLDNLSLLCNRHHRALHEGGWRVAGHPDGQLTFTGPAGRTYLSRPTIRPSTLRPPPRKAPPGQSPPGHRSAADSVPRHPPPRRPTSIPRRKDPRRRSVALRPPARAVGDVAPAPPSSRRSPTSRQPAAPAGSAG